MVQENGEIAFLVGEVIKMASPRDPMGLHFVKANLSSESLPLGAPEWLSRLGIYL